MTVHVLVKNYGREGLVICGATTVDHIASVWQAAFSDCDFVTVDTEAVPDALGITPEGMAARNAEREAV